eukprot:2224330-Prymnesium_polylepis.2
MRLESRMRWPAVWLRAGRQSSAAAGTRRPRATAARSAAAAADPGSPPKRRRATGRVPGRCRGRPGHRPVQAARAGGCRAARAAGAAASPRS